MRRLVPVLAVLLVLALSPPSRAERMESGVPWRLGGRVGFTVDAWTVPDSAGLVLEVALRVPPATMRALARDSAGTASLRAIIRVRGRAIGRTLESDVPVLLAVEDSAAGQGKVVLVRFPASPGPCNIEVRLTDLHSHRPGLVLPGGEVTFSQVISGTFAVSPPQAGREMSDIEFLWPAVGATTLSFLRAGRAVVPNPDRLYGLFAQPMRARFVARGRAGGEAHAWHWVARVFDDHGQPVAQAESTEAAGRILDGDVEFDVSRLPAGAYSLELKAWQEGDAGALVRRSAFSIGWERQTWLRNAADVADEVHFLLSSNGEEDFAVMPPGAQEKLLDEFWARRDPTPDTPTNESFDTFRERVAHANEAFSRMGATRGMFTDMGRAYIRYGEPTEISRQVIPAGNETLTQALQGIVDTESRRPESLGSPGPGGDMRPFEVWTYEGDIPLPLDVDPHDTNRGRMRHRLVFLFIDSQGTGMYRLRYSTE